LFFQGLQIHNTSPFPFKPTGVESRAMKCLAVAALLVLIAPPASEAQAVKDSYQQSPYQIQISPAVAEKLLVQKAEPVCKPIPMGSRVMGTVVLDIEIGLKGEVLHPTIISGPARLHQAGLNAVRKYKYRPYILKGKPVFVETQVAITFTCE
jgi:outer membrane biosynthesis protein TonB